MLIVVFIVAPFTNRPAPLDPGLVAVMPFTYEGSHDEDRWLASAFPVGLVPLLDGTGGLRAIPVQLMSLTMEAQGLSWDSQLSADEARTIAQAVGAGRYLSATVVSDGVHRQIAAALMDTESGEELQHIELEVDPHDVTAAIDRLVAQLLIPVAEQVRHAE
jgi:TolB-like protein